MKHICIHALGAYVLSVEGKVPRVMFLVEEDTPLSVVQEELAQICWRVDEQLHRGVPTSSLDVVRLQPLDKDSKKNNDDS